MQTSYEVTRTNPPATPVAPVPAPFLSAYSAAIGRYDFLEPGQEQQLARRWQQTRDRRRQTMHSSPAISGSRPGWREATRDTAFRWSI